MKILAVDPGYERLGIAVLEKQKNKECVVFSKCFRTSAKLPHAERLFLIGREIQNVAKKYAPHALAIETLLFNTNQKTVMRVSEARGIILYEASRHSLEVYEYTPLQIKIAITGYGRATKEQVASMICKLTPINASEKKYDDEIDAIAIGLTHLASWRA